MSSALAIATVSGLLREMLQERMDYLSDRGFDQIKVNAVLSELAKPGPDTTDHLDLFLYLVTPNPGWRNVGLPSRDSTGAETSGPPLAVDLHYLLSASSTKDLYAEIILGHALQLLHEMPVLTRGLIRAKQKAWGENEAGTMKYLAADTLSEQIELVKISPETMRADDISKLWAGFQIKYHPCVAFHASVVLIESGKQFQPAPPVAQARVYAIPFARPYIDVLSPPVGGTGDWLTLRGQNLASDRARIRFNSIEVTPGTQGQRELGVKVPAALRAGVVAIQVVHTYDLNPGLKPVDPPVEFESNVAAFLLRPSVSCVVQAAGLEVKAVPAIAKEQRVVLLLDEAEPAPGVDARSYRIDAPANNGVGDADTETDTVVFPLSGVAAGAYFVRVQVDGCLSAVDLDPGSKGFGPRVPIV